MKEIYKLWDHQQRAVDFSNTHPNMAMFYSVGVGKSGAAITILRHRFNDKKRYMRTLILAPIAILQQFKNEFDNFSRMDLRKVHAITEKGKKRVAKVQKVIEFDKNQIMILNYEALLNKEIFESLEEWQPEIVIADECHLLKNHKAKRFKAVKALTDKAQNTIIMTGTPIANNTMDIFAQYVILDGGETFGKNFFVFRNKYFKDLNAAWADRHGHFPKYVPRRSTEKELNDLIYKKAIRADKHECIDLPELLKVERKVDIKGDQAKAYKEMERDFITFVESKHTEPLAVVAQLAVTKASKLSQITSGFIYDENKVPHFFKDNPKIDELENVLKDIVKDNKVLIWCNYRAEITMISNLLKKMEIKYASIDGSISAKDKADAQYEFTNNDAVRCIVGNSAMSTGLNLQQGGYAIYYSRNYSLIINEQAEGRNYRGGSIDIHSSIISMDIIMNDSIDEKVIDSVKNKKKISDTVLNWGEK